MFCLDVLKVGFNGISSMFVSPRNPDKKLNAEMTALCSKIKTVIIKPVVFCYDDLEKLLDLTGMFLRCCDKVIMLNMCFV